MFFILSNYQKKIPFKVSTSNNLYKLNSKLDNIEFAATETYTPIQHFCCKHNQDGIFLKEDFIDAKYFTVETVFENPSIIKNEHSTYKNLICDFGDKKAKSKLNKQTIVSYIQKDSITFNVENQILPPYDKNAESPREAYSIDYMFSENVLNGFESMDYNDIEDNEFINKINSNIQYKNYILALDCLYKTLSNKIVNERYLNDYLFFYNEIKESLVKSRLTALMRDQLFVKFCILMLIVFDYEMNFDEIPSFHFSKEKVVTFLKVIGCNVTKGGKVTLEFLPKETFSSKKQRKM